MFSQNNTKFKELANLFNELEKTSSSLVMIDILANFFQKVSAEEAKLTAYLLKGKITPDYLGGEFGLAQKLVIRAIARAYNLSIEEVEKNFYKKGDLGNVAEELSNKKDSELTIIEVFKQLKQIVDSSGEGSQEQKINILSDLLKKSSFLEAKYIIRIVLGVLRLGVGDMTFLYGLSKFLVGSKKAKKTLEHAYNIFSDLGEVCYEALKYGLKKLEQAEPVVGIPTRMMLAQRINNLQEIKNHILGNVFVEYKYDGERIQAHIQKDKIELFSRKHENITHQFPDLIENLKKAFTGKNAIIEGEVVAINKKNNTLENFQILMTRRRKYDIDKYIKEVPIKYFIFDILYINNKSLIYKKLIDRKKEIYNNFQENNEINFAKCIITSDIEEIEAFFDKAIENGAEGIMIKDAESIYQAGIRGWNWIKFKKDYRDELADTFDLVVVGALYGTGRRAGTYGSLLLASFDPKYNRYYTFTKVGAGFTDKDLEEIPKKLNKFKINKKHHLVETNMKADVWFEPKLVMEVRGAEITISPVHTVAINIIKNGGLALRFPRFVRWRDDKSAEDSTTPDEIYQIYKIKNK
ncbi:MAG: ATP-dependent DNA ligase [bacterium]|nr:ATP-dependent DNA ligase [Patescibacteria group bacterium]MDW8280009.1 ATP-dependent DNA ligase [bacterium]